MDTQMLFLYGNTTGPSGKHSNAEFLWDEYARAQKLCLWLQEHRFDAPGRGIEGIVRMSAGFELIWCDFSSPSLRLVSRLNVSVPLLGYNRTSLLIESPEKRDRPLYAPNPRNGGDLPAPDWEIDWEHEPFVASQQWDWFTSASRGYSSEHLASNRELSIRPLDADVVSLYSPEYQQHLTTLVQQDREQLNLTSDGFWLNEPDQQARRDAMKKLMRRRSKHRVGDLSPQDIARFRRNMKRMISRVVSQGSHSDKERRFGSWSDTCDMIVNTFAKSLMNFQRLLKHSHVGERGPPAYAERQVALLRERAHALLMPFFEYSPEKGTPSEMQQEDLNPSIVRCKSRYLSWFSLNEAQEVGPKGGPNHHFIGQAIEEVMDGICSVLVSAGESIEETWFRDYNQGPKEPDKEQWQRLRAEVHMWHDKIENLMAWLGWSPHWMGCDRLCAWDEECYIPMWPVLRQLSHEKPAYGNRPVDPEEVENDLWHPRCLKITDFAAR
ncbi:MAG: hypothetical protein LQ344_007329 [Seirophora lacunosa]|nr:MAG: hypothetical protein LQ344_007329 [Seirophora lacunosa]